MTIKIGGEFINKGTFLASCPVCGNLYKAIETEKINPICKECGYEFIEIKNED